MDGGGLPQTYLDVCELWRSRCEGRAQATVECTPILELKFAAFRATIALGDNNVSERRRINQYEHLCTKQIWGSFSRQRNRSVSHPPPQDGCEPKAAAASGRADFENDMASPRRRSGAGSVTANYRVETFLSAVVPWAGNLKRLSVPNEDMSKALRFISVPVTSSFLC